MPVEGETAQLNPPAPQGVERERGQVNLRAQDMKVEPGNLAGLRQVNAAESATSLFVVTELSIDSPPDDWTRTLVFGRKNTFEARADSLAAAAAADLT